MITDRSILRDARAARGWIFYDSECGLCVRSMRWTGRLFESRGFRWVPLQTPGSASRLGIEEAALRARMHVLTVTGRVFPGFDALGVLCRSVWWLWPLGALPLLPGLKQLGRLGYDWLARNRHCIDGKSG